MRPSTEATIRFRNLPVTEIAKVVGEKKCFGKVAAYYGVSQPWMMQMLRQRNIIGGPALYPKDQNIPITNEVGTEVKEELLLFR